MPALLERWGGAVPRYTSYPTAAQFTDAVGPHHHGRWIATLPADPVSLYLHVPLCTRLCWYCGCHTRVARQPQVVTAYAQLLAQEVALVGAALGRRQPAGTVHLGGGTPNVLSIDDLALVLEAVHRAFRIGDRAELAAELDPVTVTRDWIRAAAGFGLNRVSLGVQTLAPQVQAAVNRPLSLETLTRAIGWLRADGITALNLDLMVGLPHQTAHDVTQTIADLLPLAPQRLAVFAYAHVPWMKAHQRLIDEATLPGPAERLEQAELAARLLEASGYVRIGLDHFARADDPLARAQAEQRLRRSFQGYTDDPHATLIGMGSSAISHLPGGYTQNHSHEVNWRRAVDRQHFATARGVMLHPQDRLRGAVIEQLMCQLSADPVALAQAHDLPADVLGDWLTALAPLIDDGLATLDGSRVVVMPRGRPFLRQVAAIFDASRPSTAPSTAQDGARRHAPAV